MNKHWFWTLPRPVLKWASIALVFVCAHPAIELDKFVAALGFAAFLYAFCGFIDKGGLLQIVQAWKGRRNVKDD